MSGRVLVLGASGFIGRPVSQALRSAGFETVGLARSARRAERLEPAMSWIEGDLNRLANAADWRGIVRGFGAIVDCSGGLQGDFRDDLGRTQLRAIEALIDACVAEQIARFVQISAPGAAIDADTAFLRTKALADRHLMASALDWTILRPALVIGRNAYGGTALVRMLAALPVQMTTYGDAIVQCVSIEELANCVVRAVGGEWAREAFDLAEPVGRPLGEMVALHRRWLGLSPVRWRIDLPPAFAVPVTLAADLAGLLGWRSALRSTAMRVMAGGVRGDPVAPAERLGLNCTSLPDILDRHMAGAQDRLAARLALLMPAIILSLALLWIGSGVATLSQPSEAARHLGPVTTGNVLTVRLFAVVDIILGVSMLWRRSARGALLSSILVTAAYLVGGLFLAPALWSNPLAPMLKTIVALVLAGVAVAALDER